MYQVFFCFFLPKWLKQLIDYQTWLTCCSLTHLFCFFTDSYVPTKRSIRLARFTLPFHRLIEELIDDLIYQSWQLVVFTQPEKKKQFRQWSLTCVCLWASILNPCARTWRWEGPDSLETSYCRRTANQRNGLVTGFNWIERVQTYSAEELNIY